MFDVFYYEDKNGKSPIADYVQDLAARRDKDSRIKLNKLYEYAKYLSETGSQAREPYAKHHTQSTLTAIYGSCARFVTGFYMRHGTVKVLSCFTIL